MTFGQDPPERNDRPADGERVPARLDTHVDVDALATRRLGESEHAEFGEQVASMGCGLAGHVEGDPRCRVEVDPHLIGILGGSIDKKYELLF